VNGGPKKKTLSKKTGAKMEYKTKKKIFSPKRTSNTTNFLVNSLTYAQMINFINMSLTSSEIDVHAMTFSLVPA